MEIVTLSAGDQLLKGWNAPSVYDGVELLANTPLAIVLPTDSGRKAALARYLTYKVIGARKSLTYVYDHDVFEHEENTYLFDLARKGLGEGRPLWEAPCHIAHAEDARDVCALLSLTMYFIWSAAVYTENGETLILVSHDEVLVVRCADEQRFKEIHEDVQVFGR